MQSPKGKENKKVSYEFFSTSQNLSPERGSTPLTRKLRILRNILNSKGETSPKETV